MRQKHAREGDEYLAEPEDDTFCNASCRGDFAELIVKDEIDAREGYGYEIGRCMDCGMPLDWGWQAAIKYLVETIEQCKANEKMEEELKHRRFLALVECAYEAVQEGGYSSGEINDKMARWKKDFGWRYDEMWKAVRGAEGKKQGERGGKQHNTGETP